jgi:ubiquinone/menaquinone biosynthesis C-methylase UbiE
MPRTELIARQSAHPRGLLGTIVACAMAYDTARVNRIALDYLQIQPSELILEVGFGSGRALSEVASRAREGFVAGVDPSEIMLRHATFRNGRYIRQGRMVLQLGEAAAIPYPEGHFDKAFAVHVLYFWPEPGRELRELRRVLRERGLLLLGFRPKDDPAVVARAPESVYKLHTIAEVKALLEETGFRDVRTETHVDRGRQMAWALARK